MLIAHWNFDNSNIDSIANTYMNLSGLSYIHGVGSTNGASITEATFSLADFEISILRDLSISFWMKTSYPSSSAGGGSFSNWFIHFGGYYNNNSAGFGLQSGKVSRYIKGSTSSGWSDAGSSSVGTAIYDDNQHEWIHIVVRFKSNNRILFHMNETLIFDTIISDAFTGASSRVVTLGKNMNMDISDVRVYSGNLSDRSINLLYRSPFSDKIRKELDKQLILWYTFNDSSSITKDDSGNEHTLELSSSPPSWTNDTNLGTGAIQFSGVEQYISTISGVNIASYDNAPFTWCAWVKTSNDGTIMGKSRSAFKDGAFDANLLLVISDGKVGWRFEYNGSNEEDHLFGSTTIDDNQWHHVAGVRDHWDFYLYIDGQLDSHHQKTDYYRDDGYREYNKALNPNSEFDIGHYRGGSGFFEGCISDIRAYAKALSPEEVEKLSEIPNVFVDTKSNIWCYSASEGPITKIYHDGRLEYDSRFDKNIIEGL